MINSRLCVPGDSLDQWAILSPEVLIDPRDEAGRELMVPDEPDDVGEVVCAGQKKAPPSQDERGLVCTIEDDRIGAQNE